MCDECYHELMQWIADARAAASKGEAMTRRVADLFGIENDHEAFRLLDLLDAEFRSDPQSTASVDRRIVARVRQCVEQRRRDERSGKVPPLLTSGTK